MFTAAGHLQSKLPVADLLDAGLLDQVFGTFTMMKHMQYKGDLECGALCTCDTFLYILLSRAMQEYEQTNGVNHPNAVVAAVAATPKWMHMATQIMLTCMDELLGELLSESAVCAFVLCMVHAPTSSDRVLDVYSVIKTCPD